MPITRPLLRRGRIREVVPEIVPPDEAVPWPATDGRNGNSAAVERVAEYEAARMEAARVEEAAAKAEAAWQDEREGAEAAQAEAARIEAEAARAEEARLEAEARQAAAREEAARERAARAEAEARDEAARQEAARLEKAREKASELEATLLTAAREEAARSEAESAESLRVGTAHHAAGRVEETSSAVPTAPRESSPAAEAVTQTSAPGVAPAVSEAAEPAIPPVEAVEWTCQIGFWRGYRKTAFYAGMFYEGEDVAVAESPHFRARGNGLPEQTPEAEAAYDALRERLEASGWRLARAGNTWFDHVFERTLITAAAEPAPE
jgi:hypothetical protein